MENGCHFPIFVLIAFSAFAQPTLISFSCSLRHPINLPPPGEIPRHSRATSDLQYDKGSAASAVRVNAGNAITPSESNATVVAGGLSVRCDFCALVVNEKVTILFYEFWDGGDLMKKFVVVICSVVLAFGLAGCWGKGKAPVGKGKAPVVQTRG